MKPLEKAARIIDPCAFDEDLVGWDGEPMPFVTAKLKAKAFELARAVLSSIEPDDAMVEAMLFAEDDRRYFQGFRYGDVHVIRDMRKSPQDQAVWSIETDDYESGHQDMMDELERIRARSVLTAALRSLLADETTDPQLPENQAI